MAKYCQYHYNVRCYHSECTRLDDMGNVWTCPLFSERDGRFTPKKVKPQFRGVFDKRVECRRGS